MPTIRVGDQELNVREEPFHTIGEDWNRVGPGPVLGGNNANRVKGN